MRRILFTLLVIFLVMANFMPAFNFNKNEASAATYTFTEDFTTEDDIDSVASSVDIDTGLGEVTMNAERQISITTSATADNPAVYENYIVYQDNRDGNYDIYLYDMTTGIETQLVDDPWDQINPDIWGDYVVWEDYRYDTSRTQIYQISTGITYPVYSGADSGLWANGAREHASPKIYDDYVVWSGDDGNAKRVFVYKIDTDGVAPWDGVFGKLSDISINQLSPDIYGDKIVWYAYTDIDPDDGNLYYNSYTYTPGSGFSFGTSSGNLVVEPLDPLDPSDPYFYDQKNPAIYDDVIVWEDKRSGIANDIYMYDISSTTETRVTDEMANQSSPKIFADVVVWVDERNGLKDLWSYSISGTAEYRLTDTSNDEAVNVYENYIVWQRGGDIYGQYNLVRSEVVDTAPGNINDVTLTSTESLDDGTKIDYYVSNDDGTTWESVLPGVGHTFSSSGSSLRWSAIFSSVYELTPTLSEVALEYEADDTPLDDGSRRHDLVPPGEVLGVGFTKFPYANYLMIDWNNPDDDDLAGIDIYRQAGECQSADDIEVVEEDLLFSTSGRTSLILDFTIEDWESDYCYYFVARDENVNYSEFISVGVNPGEDVTDYYARRDADESDSEVDAELDDSERLDEEDDEETIEDDDSLDEDEDSDDSSEESDVGDASADSADGSSGASGASGSSSSSATKSIFRSDLMNYIIANGSCDIVEKAHEDYNAMIHSRGLMDYLAGRFVLLVNAPCPANLYYVSHSETDPHRYVLNWGTMLDIFGQLSLGISGRDLSAIPACDSADRDNPYGFETSRLLIKAGTNNDGSRENGEIYYYNLQEGGCIQPITWDNMWQELPVLALGVDINNLFKIPLGRVNNLDK